MNTNSFGKTIRLFLLEGSTNGLVTAELSNWTGKAFRIPRIKLKDYATRTDLQKPGIYLLFGKNEANEDASYVGEAENGIERLQQQLSKGKPPSKAILHKDIRASLFALKNHEKQCIG